MHGDGRRADTINLSSSSCLHFACSAPNCRRRLSLKQVSLAFWAWRAFFSANFLRPTAERRFEFISEFDRLLLVLSRLALLKRILTKFNIDLYKKRTLLLKKQCLQANNYFNHPAWAIQEWYLDLLRCSFVSHPLFSIQLSVFILSCTQIG